jgi:hypothetical protein
VDAKRPILPDPLQKAAAELAEASGISFNQFIAAAVADKVGTIRAAMGSMTDSPLVPAVRRSYGSVAMGSGKEVEAIQDGLAKGDLDEASFWRRPKVTPPNVRRAAIIKKRSAKFPWTGPTRTNS